MKRIVIAIVLVGVSLVFVGHAFSEQPAKETNEIVRADKVERETNRPAKTDASPLLPADTSSPRATLLGFLADTTKVINEFREDRKDKSTYRAFLRASKVLDYSTTPGGDSWFVRKRRVALLQELLARVELPPANTIPGDREVAGGKITHWTIPKTGITIARVEEGPQAGQFLFSAETVQALDRLYRQVKQLPYRPGATPGVYEAMVSADEKTQAQEQQIRNRLKPIDTSSPRSTLEGFLDDVNRAYVLASRANNALMASPPTMTRKEGRQAEANAVHFLQRASDTLDLRNVPETLRPAVGIEATLLLKEILDRLLLPPLDVTPRWWRLPVRRTRTTVPGRTERHSAGHCRIRRSRSWRFSKGTGRVNSCSARARSGGFATFTIR